MTLLTLKKNIPKKVDTGFWRKSIYYDNNENVPSLSGKRFQMCCEYVCVCIGGGSILFFIKVQGEKQERKKENKMHRKNLNVGTAVVLGHVHDAHSAGQWVVEGLGGESDHTGVGGLLDSVFLAEDDLAGQTVAEDSDLLGVERNDQDGDVVLEHLGRDQLHVTELQNLAVGNKALLDLCLESCGEDIVGLVIASWDKKTLILRIEQI